MANASPDFIWGVVRDTSCFILKARQSGRTKTMGKRGAEFTMEPNNPTSRNAWKYSGLANAKTVDVTPVDGGVVLTTKTKDAKRAGKVSIKSRSSCRGPGYSAGGGGMWLLRLLAAGRATQRAAAPSIIRRRTPPCLLSISLWRRAAATAAVAPVAP